MKRFPPLFCLTALALLGLAGPKARAEFFSFSYNWSLRPFVIPAEGTGGITVTDGSSGTAVGSADATAGLLTTFSSATPDAPDRFINKSYSLRLDLRDDASLASGFLNFTGVLNGTLTGTSANITNTYATPTTQRLTLGHQIYTVDIGEFPALPPPGFPVIESIPAHISVSGPQPTPPPVQVQNTPEPSGLVLAALGISWVGLVFWRKWTRRE